MKRTGAESANPDAGSGIPRSDPGSIPGRRRLFDRFFGRDWISDANLRRCSLEARGLWIDVVALMIGSDQYGELTGDPRTLGRLIGTDGRVVHRCLIELFEKGVLEVLAMAGGEKLSGQVLADLSGQVLADLSGQLYPENGRGRGYQSRLFGVYSRIGCRRMLRHRNDLHGVECRSERKSAAPPALSGTADALNPYPLTIIQKEEDARARTREAGGRISDREKGLLDETISAWNRAADRNRFSRIEIPSPELAIWIIKRIRQRPTLAAELEQLLTPPAAWIRKDPGFLRLHWLLVDDERFDKLLGAGYRDKPPEKRRQEPERPQEPRESPEARAKARALVGSMVRRWREEKAARGLQRAGTSEGRNPGNGDLRSTCRGEDVRDEAAMSGSSGRR